MFVPINIIMKWNKAGTKKTFIRILFKTNRPFEYYTNNLHESHLDFRYPWALGHFSTAWQISIKILWNLTLLAIYFADFWRKLAPFRASMDLIRVFINHNGDLNRELLAQQEDKALIEYH